MRLLTNINQNAFQEHIILFGESEVTLILRYASVVQQWFFDATYKDFTITGIKLAVDTLHMLSANQPFDFIVTDESKSGLDPFKLSDFADNRTLLYILEADDMEQIRGVEVPI